MGAEGIAWATTGTRWMIAAIMLIFVAALTPASAGLRLRRKREARLQLEVGTGTAISNIAEWGGFNVTFIIATWVSIAANAVYGYSVQVMGVCFMFYLGIATAGIRARGRGYRAGQSGRGEECRSPGRGRHDGDGGYSRRAAGKPGRANLAASGAGGCDHRGIAIAPAIAALLWLAAAATVFDGLQATASFALRAQGMVWLPSAIHLSSFFVVMIPVCYWLAIPLGRGAAGVLEGAFVGVFVAGTAQFILLEWKAARPGVERAA